MKKCQSVRKCESPATWECIAQSRHKTSAHRRLVITNWCDEHAEEIKAIETQAEWNARRPQPADEARDAAAGKEKPFGGTMITERKPRPLNEEELQELKSRAIPAAPSTPQGDGATPETKAAWTWDTLTGEGLKRARETSESLERRFSAAISLGSSAEKALSAALAELAEARKDTELLEWIIKHNRIPQLHENAIGTAHPNLRAALRAAIDRAREQEA